MLAMSPLQSRSVSHVSRGARSHPVLATPRCLRTAAFVKLQTAQTQHRNNTSSICRAQAGTPTLSYAETPSVAVMERGELSQFPGSPGVYAVYDKDGTLQYIGLSRQVRSDALTGVRPCPQANVSQSLDSSSSRGSRCCTLLFGHWLSHRGLWIAFWA